MSEIIISVVICTHNRAGLAHDAIASVLDQHNLEKCELIIVDNASVDHTSQMAREFVQQYPNVRYFFEPKVGLSNARNRGWQEAGGEYVGYLDDDCKVSPQWLSAACRVATEIHPDAFGGPYYAFYNSPKPAWFKDEYASHVQGDVARPLKENEYLDGGNMFIRREILQDFTGFHSGLGMKGDRIAFGEETYFFRVLREKTKNAVLYYDPSVYVYHLVRPEKYDLWIAPKRFFISGMYWSRISDDGAHASILRLLALLAKELLIITWSYVKGVFVRDRTQYPYLQNYVFEKILPCFSLLGLYADSLRRIFIRAG